MKLDFAPAIALALCSAAFAAHAAPRTYVSANGNDARGRCTLSSPCRTFQVAHDTVDAGGEVVALDTADYGPVLVAKSVSILGAPGFVASIEATGTGVTIEVPGVNVVLRHLSIRGTGGKWGIDMPKGASLTVEHCVVSNMTVDGLRVSTAADVRIVASTFRGNGGHGAFLEGGVTADVVGSMFMGNGAAGLYLESASGNFMHASVSDSVASGNGTHGFALRGILGRSWMTLNRVNASNNVESGVLHENPGSLSFSTLSIGGSMATGNGTGFKNVLSNFASLPLFESLGNNVVRGNTQDVFGTVAAMPAL